MTAVTPDALDRLDQAAQLALRGREHIPSAEWWEMAATIPRQVEHDYILAAHPALIRQLIRAYRKGLRVYRKGLR